VNTTIQRISERPPAGETWEGVPNPANRMEKGFERPRRLKVKRKTRVNITRMSGIMFAGRPMFQFKGEGPA